MSLPSPSPFPPPSPSAAFRPPRLLALAGPTAAGKTDASLALAREFDAEIVSVDSALVYRGMDIGTAKPTAQQLAAVPHHLVDIRDPAQPYSAAEFVADATIRVAQIQARGRLALLVGGTMLYFKALFDGLDEMPAADPDVRARLEREAADRGWPALHAELAAVDPRTAARLAPHDSQRIQRALEVYRSAGRPLSEFQQGRPGRGLRPAALLSLEPGNRGWLHERIARRFDAMLQAGFLDEVRALRARGDLHPGLPSMRCVGYRQAWEALDAGWTPAMLRERGIAATRQLAKRQLTWLRSMERRTVACDGPDPVGDLLQAAREVLR
ncbi:tRNA (adenosine(37)-N6)-dimethylallyltransferase MiaA [Ramlibacter sp.]|uniref:tRNA (adenosine(37)-N6)-dimethylallyltransferase MiaA n=1 Tax=Ramlibacter sp. TaxID=1917967 RepID=UPI0039C9BE4A